MVYNIIKKADKGFQLFIIEAFVDLIKCLFFCIIYALILKDMNRSKVNFEILIFNT